MLSLAFCGVAHLSISTATHRDAEGVFGLRREAEGWLATRGVTQWDPGEVTLPDISRQIDNGEWHVATDGCELLGALRLLWSDEAIWQHEDRFAAYVHGLMVARRYAGGGVGADLLRWAETQAKSRHAPSLRLDCVETNERLRRYYSELGFIEVGRRDFDGPWHSATLLEKAV